MNKIIPTKKEKVLIFGGLGFIGSNLALKFVERGAEVTIFDNLDPNSGGNLFNIDVFKEKIEVIQNSIVQYDELIKVIENKQKIFNCAASSSHSLSMKEPWKNLEINSKGVLNILEALKECDSKAAFVHLGTTTQFGSLIYEPADEFHPEFPTDIYSANKMVGEKYVLLYSKAYGLNTSVVRLPNTYGPRAAIYSANFNFNNYFIGLALQNKKITVFKPGDQLRNVLYVDDAVEALILAAESDLSKGKTFLAVTDEHYSVKELAEKTCRLLGGSVSMVDWPEDLKKIEVGNAKFTNQMIKSILKWSPKIDLDNGLRLTKEYFSKNLQHYLD